MPTTEFNSHVPVLLQWKDDRGRTPLLVACSVPEGYDATVLLLQLGANMRAFRPGKPAGRPTGRPTGRPAVPGLFIEHRIARFSQPSVASFGQDDCCQTLVVRKRKIMSMSEHRTTAWRASRLHDDGVQRLLPISCRRIGSHHYSTSTNVWYQTGFCSHVHGLPPIPAGPEGGYPMHHAARRGCDQTLNLLFQKGGDPRPRGPWQEPVISCGQEVAPA